MANLRRLSAEQLQNYLLNAIRHIDERPDETARLIPEILNEMLARRQQSPSTEHLLTTLGYNVRWRDWHAKERHRLLAWLIDASLPGYIESVMGSPASPERKSFIADTIERWSRRYGRQPNMEQALARWNSDLAFIRVSTEAGRMTFGRT